VSTTQILVPAGNGRHEPNSKCFEPLYCRSIYESYEGLPSAALAKR